MTENEIDDIRRDNAIRRENAAQHRAESRRLILEANAERNAVLAEKREAIRKIRQMYADIY